ncbi:hypothetical protein PCIT_a0957 [Pseudoalteromonas citrea]|uniref:Uncharacterized protein n=1 Tax=Pseudoalteromonas citrea TaxID=43655 RepID=A0AAD4ALT7_9GAMM|nr:hypothetical protein PCIT_a0957 [Pseudoalteromonas citrea]
MLLIAAEKVTWSISTAFLFCQSNWSRGSRQDDKANPL